MRLRSGSSDYLEVSVHVCVALCVPWGTYSVESVCMCVCMYVCMYVSLFKSFTRPPSQ